VVAAVDLDPWQQSLAEDALNRRILELAASVALAENAGLHLLPRRAPGDAGWPPRALERAERVVLLLAQGLHQLREQALREHLAGRTRHAGAHLHERESGI